MKSQNPLVYGVVIVCAFLIGFAGPLIIPPEGYALLSKEHPVIKRNGVLKAVLVATSATMTIVFMILLAFASRGRPPVVRTLIKLVFFAMVASSLGSLTAVALGFLGVYQPPWASPEFLLIGGALYFAGGIAGMMTLRQLPESRNALCQVAGVQDKLPTPKTDDSPSR